MRRVAPSLAGYRGLRGDLLVALKKAQPLTAGELAERFGVTPNALRRHLKALEEGGVVQYCREVRGVGGPVYAYTLTASGEALFPHGYASTLNMALQAIHDEHGVEGLIALFRRQWAGIVGDAKPRLAELPLAERAQLMAELRTSQGYMAEMREIEGDEAGTGAPAGVMILEHHCAIREAAERFPEICAAELEFFEDVLGADVERRTHILSGCNHCEYRVTERAATAPPATYTNGTTTTTTTITTAAPARAASDMRDPQGDEEKQA